MLIRWLFAAAHLLALGIGLGAVWARSGALRSTLDQAGIRRVLRADLWWGIAALLWLLTGVMRAFGGLEKGTDYYVANHLFWTKMGVFVTVVVLEIRLATTFGAWRRQLARGELPDTSRATGFASTSRVQAVLIVVMVLLATAMARGYGVAR